MGAFARWMLFGSVMVGVGCNGASQAAGPVTVPRPDPVFAVAQLADGGTLQVVVMDADGGNVSTIYTGTLDPSAAFNVESYTFARVRWLPDGTGVAFVRKDNGGLQLVQVGVSLAADGSISVSEPVVRIGADRFPVEFAMAADGRVAYISLAHPGTVRLFEADSTAATDPLLFAGDAAAGSPEGLVHDLDWSRDGVNLAFDIPTYPVSYLDMLDLSTPAPSGLALITGGFPTRPLWAHTAASRLIYTEFETGSGKPSTRVLDVTDAQHPVVTSVGDGIGLGWTDDDARVLYLVPDGGSGAGIWSYTLATGAVERMAGAFGLADWRPCGSLKTTPRCPVATF